MLDGKVYAKGWSPNDILWANFDASKIEPWMLYAIKAAALVEYNAPDYVTYLRRIFKDSGPDTLAAIDEWGREESQHGKTLGRWAEMADPSFKLGETFARFHKGYRPAHFANPHDVSVRGSRRAEMIARCVVESGTSSYYSAIKDATDEPVLKEIVGRIAADEFRHYRLFYEILHKQDEPDLSFWKKLRVAVARVNESDDDELSYAYYCATVPVDQEATVPYVRAAYAKAGYNTTLRIYRRHHIGKLTQMVAKAVGADPHGRLAKLAEALLWRLLKLRAGRSGANAEVAT